MALAWRPIKFWILSRLCLPLALVIFRLLVRTYRIDAESRAGILDACRHPKLIVASCHGSFVALMAGSLLTATVGRKVCVMTSPSRDGQLLDAAIEGLGHRVVKGSSKSRAAAGAVGFVREIEAGYIGVLAIDGPRGPRTVPKPGFIRLAETSGAFTMVVSASASSAVRLRTWDRMFFPLPFARLRILLSPFPPGPSGETEEAAIERLRRQVLEEGRKVGSPVVEGVDA